MTEHKTRQTWDMEVDLVAMGSSAGGLVGALVGHDLGLKTVVLERADVLGGATATSGGAIWIPFNKYMAGLGITDSREETLGYIRRVSMGHHDEALLAAYLDNCNPMLDWVEKNTPLVMACQTDASRTEYCADVPGGKPMGRKLWPDPRIMPPILEEAEKAQPMVAKTRKDTVRHLAGPRPPWVQGRGLIGPLVMACVSRNIDILTDTRGVQLVTENGRVVGLRAVREGRDFFVKAKRGVLLAAGGFEWNAEMNKRFIYGPFLHSNTVPTNEGDGHIMGMELGAAVALMDHSIFQPGLSMPGEVFGDRAFSRPFVVGLPGMILVNREGRRCCDECFYPDMGRALIAYDRIKGAYSNWPVFFICDQSFRDTIPILTLKRGADTPDWLKRSDTLEGLAGALGIPADNFAATIKRFNDFARVGQDPDFHRGESTYDRQWGEVVFPGRKPSPVLGTLEKPPYYGVQVNLTTAGNLGGLVTNTSGQVIDVRGQVIAGLYATSNTQAMLILGHHYDSGAAQGKSMVFGYIAARHMAGAAK